MSTSASTAPIAPKFTQHGLAFAPAWLSLWAAALTFVFLLLPFGKWDAELYSFCNTGMALSMIMFMVCLGCALMLERWADERNDKLCDAYCDAVRVWEAERKALMAQASAAVSALADFEEQLTVPLKPASNPNLSEWKLTKDGTRRYRRIATQVMVTRWATQSEPIEFEF